MNEKSKKHKKGSGVRLTLKKNLNNQHAPDFTGDVGVHVGCASI